MWKERLARLIHTHINAQPSLTELEDICEKTNVCFPQIIRWYQIFIFHFSCQFKET